MRLRRDRMLVEAVLRCLPWRGDRPLRSIDSDVERALRRAPQWRRSMQCSLSGSVPLLDDLAVLALLARDALGALHAAHLRGRDAAGIRRREDGAVAVLHDGDVGGGSIGTVRATIALRATRDQRNPSRRPCRSHRPRPSCPLVPVPFSPFEAVGAVQPPASPCSPFDTGVPSSPRRQPCSPFGPVEHLQAGVTLRRPAPAHRCRPAGPSGQRPSRPGVTLRRRPAPCRPVSPFGPTAPCGPGHASARDPAAPARPCGPGWPSVVGDRPTGDCERECKRSEQREHLAHVPNLHL